MLASACTWCSYHQQVPKDNVGVGFPCCAIKENHYLSVNLDHGLYGIPDGSECLAESIRSKSHKTVEKVITQVVTANRKSAGAIRIAAKVDL
jgi:hypothetical protein